MALFLVAAVCGTVGICLDQAGIALGRPSGTRGALPARRRRDAGAAFRSPRRCPGTDLGAGAAFAAWTVSSVVHLPDGSGAAQELGRLPLPRPGPHRQPAAPRRGGGAEPPADPDRATSRAAGPGPRGPPRLPGGHGVLVSRLDAGVGRLHGAGPGGAGAVLRRRPPTRRAPEDRAVGVRLGTPPGWAGRGACWPSSRTPCSPLIGAEYADASATALRVLTLGLIPFAVWQSYNARCRAAGQVREGIVAGLVLAATICLATVWAAPTRSQPPWRSPGCELVRSGAVWAAWRAADPGEELDQDDRRRRARQTTELAR